MNDFFDSLREDARPLRYEPEDAVLWNRITARVRERIVMQPSVPLLLAHWFRPITASFLLLALASALSLAWLERPHDSADSIEAMSQNSVEISVDGDTFNLAQ